MGCIDETRRVSRLLDIAWRIAAAPRQWTRTRLATLYEVSERQITSDLTLMRHCLHWQVRTCHSGYYFDPLPSVSGVQCTLPEALALLLAVRASMALPSVGSIELTAAIARLASLVPPHLQALVAVPESPPSPREQTLRTLQRALGQRRRVHLAYKTASRDGAVTERDFDPYAIFPYGRSWHVIGYCHLRDAIRDFKADRIAPLPYASRSMRFRPISIMHMLSGYASQTTGHNKGWILRFCGIIGTLVSTSTANSGVRTVNLRCTTAPWV